MKKIFTLFATSLLAVTAYAQSGTVGIYTDWTSKSGKISGFENEDEDIEFGIHTVGDVKVALAEGETVKSVVKMKKLYKANKETDFNSGRLFYAGITESADIELLYCSGFRDGTSSDDCTYSSDNDATSRFPEEDDINEEGGYYYGRTDVLPMSTESDMAALNPDYWVGASIEVPAGQHFDVSKVSVKVAAGNSFWWCINIYSENGTALYKSGTCALQFSNGDKNTEGYWMGGSADITSTGIEEPNGGTQYQDGGELAAAGLSLPITAEKVAAYEAATEAKFANHKTPMACFQPLPENLQLPAGKNTARIYFGKRNSRLFCPVELSVIGELAAGEAGIETVSTTAATTVYTLLGQKATADAKGLQVRNGKITYVK